MTAIVLHLASLSAKIALLGGIAWTQLYLLRRAPASSRSRLCSLALIAILLLSAGEMLAPNWTVKAPVYTFTAGTSSARHTSHAAAGVDYDFWLAVIWMSGATLMLLRACVGRTALAMLLYRSVSVEKSGGIDVRIAEVQTPILAGLLRPAILLPEAARDWTGDQRRMVLTHELTHWRQRDVWTNLLAQLLRATFWFHPIVWLLVSRMSREQEETCDEAVIASGQSQHDYAAFLLHTARGLKSREMFACSMTGSGARSLKQRFANLLDPMPRLALKRRIVVLLASFALAATTLTVVRPVWSQSNEKKNGAYRVGANVTAPKLLHRVDPDYTPEAKADHIEGTVLLQVIVMEEGTADSIKVVRGIDPGLDQKAIEAVTKWIFQPGTKDGVPVPVYATIEVHFRLK